VAIRRSLPALLALWSCLACNAAAPDPKADEGEPPAVGEAVADFAWDGVSTRSHRDVASALRFSVPITGHRVTSTQFDPSSPPIKLKHELRIEQDRREVARIDVWHDVEALGLTAWFDKYLRFMVTRDAIVERSRASRARVDAIVVRHPRSPQAPAQRAVVIELEGRIVRVTSIADEDSRARAVFDRVLDDLELEAPL
jgi:hypothetical protein